MSKPREWNLVIYGVSNPHGHIQPVRTWLGEEITEETKVIEYSAYEKLRNSNEELETELKCEKELKRLTRIGLQNKLQSAIEALETILINAEINGQVGTAAHARRSLAKIEKDEV